MGGRDKHALIEIKWIGQCVVGKYVAADSLGWNIVKKSGDEMDCTGEKVVRFCRV